MTRFHQNLHQGKWDKLSLVEQMANIGSEVSRTIIWKEKDQENAKKSFYRTLELIELTLKDSKNLTKTREVSRVKEMLVDWYLGNPLYKSTDEDWQKYFLQFNLAARINT